MRRCWWRYRGPTAVPRDGLRLRSPANPAEQIRVRIDDKLSRLARGEAAGEDVKQDLLGYLVLLEIAHLRADREAQR
jgi:hypothetical protein